MSRTRRLKSVRRAALLGLGMAATPVDALAGGLEDALGLLSQHAHLAPPALSAKDVDRLARGESVTLVDQQSIVGLTVVPASLEQAWATVHDPAVTGDPAVREVRLSADEHGTELWYGRMTLPTPIADREWVVRSVVNAGLHASSGGRAWERHWTEVPDGLELARPALRAGHLPGVSHDSLGQAVFTPVNRGGWMLVALDPDRTLVAYQARTDLGGSVPSWLVRDVARSQVGQLLARVIRDARRTHPAVVRGDGSAG